MPPRVGSSRVSGDGGSGGGGGGGVGRKRYAAVVEKGENAWKREWNSFISGVDMKRVRDGTTSVALRARADLAHGADKDSDSDGDSRSRRSRPSDRKKRKREAEEEEDRSGEEGRNASSFSAAPASFSYLFSSPAERRAERSEKKKRQDAARRHERQGKTVSKHQLAMAEAQKRGLKLEGMSRKQVRDFLHLTRSKEQEEAQQHSRELKLYELMDEKLAWYQQGPHPIDLIAERLVARKAAKKGKRLGLTRYNYLLPHPSWMAVRRRRRTEGILVGLGKRFTFDEETGQAMDPLHGNAPVDLTKVNFLLHGGEGREEADGDGATADATPWDAAVWRAEDLPAGDGSAIGEKAAASGEAKGRTEENEEDGAGHVDSRMLDSLLIDPTRALTTFSRAVVKNREAALAIKRANLTTNFLSASLVQGPSIGLDDDAEDENAKETERGNTKGRLHTSAAEHRGKEKSGAVARTSRSSFEPVAEAEQQQQQQEGDEEPEAPPPPRRQSSREEHRKERVTKRQRPSTRTTPPAKAKTKTNHSS